MQPKHQEVGENDGRTESGFAFKYRSSESAMNICLADAHKSGAPRV